MRYVGVIRFVGSARPCAKTPKLVVVFEMGQTLGSQLGASTTKWTTLERNAGLSDIDSKLYTDFEFCEGKNVVLLK